jgi:hypothetical protein
MRFERLLTHLCTISLPIDVIKKDPYNRPIYKERPTPDVPCRVDQIKRSVSVDTNGVDNIVDNVLFLSPTSHVGESMKIMNIIDKNGEVVLAGTFKVEHINPIWRRNRLHHYEITLKKESG